MSKWARRLVIVVLAPTVLLLAAGCEDVNAIKQENQNLKAGNAALKQQVDQLTSENANLKSEVTRLQGDLAAKIAALEAMKNLPPITVPAPKPPEVVKVDNTPKLPEDFGDAEVTRTKDAITLNMAGDVLFASGKDVLKTEALATLDKIAKVIKTRYAANKLRVIGHTDSDPIKKSGWHDNIELSMARAKAVGNYLIRQGVAAANLEITGVGNSDPRVPEKTTADKAKNRRVVVQVILKT